ncbi:conserved hypothetical protein [Bacillus mycoides]|uniref:Uncharacterized protein n=1 Tax=Bacillus mycoides TaxID=1405 RepID=A0A654BZ61_BACMY|nr:conserved hypothetical protein [Bacillus mycoides]
MIPLGILDSFLFIIFLHQNHTKLSLKCNTKIIKGGVINIQDIENIKTLEHECTELRLEINDYLENLPEND